MNKIFSIITVVKNNSLGLQKTLLSIFEQDYPYIQSIVIDGGSTDNTMSIAKNFTGIHTLISEKDKGIYDAMNKGLSYANGQWVLFLNADDVLDGNTVISKIHKFIQAHPQSNIICGHTKEIFCTQEIIRNTKDISTLPIHMPACHQSMLIQTSILQANLFDTSYKICGDLDQLSRILSTNNNNIAFYPDSISIISGVGLSNTQWKITMQERTRIQKQYYPNQSKTLKSYHNTLKIKILLRSLLPIKIQLLIRKYIHKK